MKITILLVLVTCLVLSSLAFSQKAAARPASAPASATSPAAPAVTQTSEGCVIERFDVDSPSMKRHIHALVVLPPGYGGDAARRYPVLYTLHGSDAPYACWSEMSPLRRALRDRPMIVASFDGDKAGWYIDSTTKPDSQFTTFFFDEFLPYVDSHYRTNGQRGVTGFSMGGYGALHYMLCRPEMFCSASSLSGAFSAMGDANGQVSTTRNWLRGLLGDYEQNRQEYAKRAIFGRIAEDVKKHVKLPPILLHCGTEDHLLAESRMLTAFMVEQNKLIADEVARESASETDKDKRDKLSAGLLAARKIDFHSVESPGGHTWPFWRDASECVIDFHWRSFRDAAK